MAELKTYTSVAITDLFNRLDQVKNNPTLGLRAAIETFDEVTNGTLELVDPSNPAVFLMEVSAVLAAANAQESIVNLRKQYPSLSQTESDLYHHMSDRDYLGRFASPATATVKMVVQWQQLQQAMLEDLNEGCRKAVIPRDTAVVVDGVSFMMQYPVAIRLYNNGVLSVSYDNTIVSPLFSTRSNIIRYTVRPDNDGAQWLMFDVGVLQVDVVVSEDTVQKSRRLNTTIALDKPFYALRAFYQHSTTGADWHEMKVTHSDLVYDPNTPTACVQVLTNSVRVQIPTVYQQNGMIEGSIKFYAYTTLGAVAFNFTNYNVDSFSVKLQALDEKRDMTLYSSLLGKVSIHAMIQETVSGGADALTFDELRYRVINNSTGNPVIPITNLQAQTLVQNNGFELVKNSDTLTNRIFLGTRKLPEPTNKRLLTAANIGMNTVIITSQAIEGHPNVRINGKRWTLLSNNLYKNENGIIQLMSLTEINAFKALPVADMTTVINLAKHLYSPFHYVLDSTEKEFTTRAYYLDSPTAQDISFIRQNQTLQLIVNTAGYYIEKVATGYRLFVTTESGTFFKQLQDNAVGAQLGFYPPGQTTLVYIKGVQAGISAAGDRIYQFDIVTNYDIDAENNMRVTSALVKGSSNYNIRIALDATVYIFYTTTSLTPTFKPDETELLIGKEFLPQGSVAVTQEELSVTFGKVLKNLWTRTRTLPTGVNYARYTQDVPMTYMEDVYHTDPVTGSIFTVTDGKLFYNKLHSQGEVVYDADNQVVMKHHVGDVMLDSQGNPVTLSIGAEYKEIDLLFIDGKHYFVTDPAYLDYNRECATILAEWITQDLQSVQDVLLEQTRIYFYPKNQLGYVQASLSDGQTVRISSEQSLKLELDVGLNVYNNADIRQQLTEKTIKLLDKMISGTEVNLVSIKTALTELYGNSVVSFSLTGLGGALNLRYLKLVSEEQRLCLKRILYAQQDGILIMKEDVGITFHRVD